MEHSIKESDIVFAAQQAARYALSLIIGRTNIPRDIAMGAVKDAGDKFAAQLTLSLTEAQVKVVPRG